MAKLEKGHDLRRGLSCSGFIVLGPSSCVHQRNLWLKSAGLVPSATWSTAATAVAATTSAAATATTAASWTPATSAISATTVRTVAMRTVAGNAANVWRAFAVEVGFAAVRLIGKIAAALDHDSASRCGLALHRSHSAFGRWSTTHLGALFFQNRFARQPD